MPTPKKPWYQEAADAFADLMDGTIFDEVQEAAADGAQTAATAASSATGAASAAATGSAAPGTGPLIPETDGSARRARAAAGNHPPRPAPAGQPAGEPAAAAGTAAVPGAGGTGNQS